MTPSQSKLAQPFAQDPEQTSSKNTSPSPSNRDNDGETAVELATIYNKDKLLDADSIQQTLKDCENLPVQWVSDYDALELCLDDLEALDCVALDTEFIKRNTYYPILALIQINTGSRIYLIDAPKLDLSEFWVVMEEMPLMIWHACGEDLSIFYLLSEAPPLTNVFDTQIALSYLTGRLQMGYQQAVDQQLDIQLEKGESQSDWLARPLTHKQEHYAIDDVRYLLALFEILNQQLKKRGLIDKVHEDCQLYAAELYEATYIEDDATYLSMADYRYTGQQLAVLQAVSAWREALARATNQPKTFVLKKQAVREVVTEQPKTIRQLHHKTSMNRSMIRLYGEELLTIINEASEANDEGQPAKIAAPYRSKDKTLSKLVQKAIKDYAKKSDIPTEVLMRKKWLAALYEVVAYDLPIEQLPQGLLGWRKPWVVETLIPLLESHKEELKAGMGINGNLDSEASNLDS